MWTTEGKTVFTELSNSFEASTPAQAKMLAQMVNEHIGSDQLKVEIASLKAQRDAEKTAARFAESRVAELEAVQAVNPADVHAGVSQAISEMSGQIYNAVSETVFSYLQKNGVRCPKEM